MAEGGWSAQADPDGSKYLERLKAAAQPFILSPGPMPAIAVRVFAGDPLVVDVVFDQGPPYRTTGAGGDGAALAEAVGELLEAGLNRLPEDAKRAVAARLEAGDDFFVELDLLFSLARGVLLGEAGAVVLFVLTDGADAN